MNRNLQLFTVPSNRMKHSFCRLHSQIDSPEDLLSFLESALERPRLQAASSLFALKVCSYQFMTKTTIASIRAHAALHTLHSISQSSGTCLPKSSDFHLYKALHPALSAGTCAVSHNARQNFLTCTCTMRCIPPSLLVHVQTCVPLTAQHATSALLLFLYCSPQVCQTA